jgi:hypothetical protein
MQTSKSNLQRRLFVFDARADLNIKTIHNKETALQIALRCLHVEFAEMLRQNIQR